VVRSIVLSVMLLLPAALLAQSPQSAVGGDASIWGGAEVSAFDPDYSCTGLTVFNCKGDLVGPAALFDFNLTGKIGAEGEARWLNWNGGGGEKESNYLIGPRYRAYRHSRYAFWIKGLVGGGWITTPNYPAAGSLKGSYLDVAPGGTIEYHFSRRLLLRADYEYQFWPAFAGPNTYSSTGTVITHNGGITPNGFSLGVMYRFLGR
jgi:hypothetical protein